MLGDDSARSPAPSVLGRPCFAMASCLALSACDPSAPLEFPATPQLYATSTLTCIVADDGGLDCWGSLARFSNGRAQMFAPIASVSDAHGLECGLTVMARVSCWRAQEAPRPIVSLEQAVELGNGCAVTSAGEVRCWDAEGTEARPLRGLGPIVEVEGNRDYGCARGQHGEVRCWSRAGRPRRLGIDDAVDIALHGEGVWVVHTSGRVSEYRSPSGRWRSGLDEAEREVVGIDDAVEVDGERGACARRSTGEVACWHGGGYQPLFPDWDERGAYEAYAVPGITDAVELVVNSALDGVAHACVRLSAREPDELGVHCWGVLYDNWPAHRVAIEPEAVAPSRVRRIAGPRADATDSGP